MSDSEGGRDSWQAEKAPQIWHQNLARTVTASNLFYSKGLVEFARYVSPDTLFVFDLDGTLAPIATDNSDTRVDEAVRNTLQRLVKLADVAVITGRSRKETLAMLGFEPQLVIGNHGAELPMEACTKGEALVAAMGELGAKRLIYFGDDITVLTLEGVDVFGIHIGAKDPTTVAFYLNSQSEMLGLLNSMVGILEPKLMSMPWFIGSAMD